MEWARQLNCEVIDLWFGQDGYGLSLPGELYLRLAVDHRRSDRMRRAPARVKIVLEYKTQGAAYPLLYRNRRKDLAAHRQGKPPECRRHDDVGHALEAYENTAESAALLQYFGDNLFYMHFNDNWRLWDDDMTVGSVHTIEMLEIALLVGTGSLHRLYALDISPIAKWNAGSFGEHPLDSRPSCCFR